MRGHWPCFRMPRGGTFYTFFVLLLTLSCVNGISYRCENNQVLIVQSFGNDTIRMHCQRLHLCGYEKLECGYDHEQPNCGGKQNFVAHVNQLTATGPVQHTCCELKLPNEKQNVPGHDGNDCFVYELPDGTHDDKKSKDSRDDITVLKNVNQIAEQFEGGNVGYRMRLFMLKNKSPPTLIVKAIERVTAGYRVTICRPRCGKFSKEGEVGQDVQTEEVLPSHPNPIEGKEQWTAGKDGNEYQALQWGSWTSSTWETWKVTESTEDADKKSGATGGTRSRLSRVHGKGGDQDDSSETPAAIASASASATSGSDTESGASGASGVQSKKGDEKEKLPKVEKGEGDHNEKHPSHHTINNNNINISAKGGKGGKGGHASINLPHPGGNQGGRRRPGAEDENDNDSLGKRPSSGRKSAHDSGDDDNLNPINEDGESGPDSEEDDENLKYEKRHGKKGPKGRQNRVHHNGKAGSPLDEDDSEEEPLSKHNNGKIPSGDDENEEGPSDGLGNESPDSVEFQQKLGKKGEKKGGKKGPSNRHKSKSINDEDDGGNDSSTEPSDNNGPTDTDEDLTSRNKSGKSKGGKSKGGKSKGGKSKGKGGKPDGNDGKLNGKPSGNDGKLNGKPSGNDGKLDGDERKNGKSDGDKSNEPNGKPKKNHGKVGDSNNKLDGDIDNKKSKLGKGRAGQAHSEIPDDSDHKKKPNADDGKNGGIADGGKNEGIADGGKNQSGDKNEGLGEKSGKSVRDDKDSAKKVDGGKPSGDDSESDSGKKSDVDQTPKDGSAESDKSELPESRNKEKNERDDNSNKKLGSDGDSSNESDKNLSPDDKNPDNKSPNDKSSDKNSEANKLSGRRAGGHDASESNPDGDSPNEEDTAEDSNIKLPDQRVKTNIETPESSEEGSNPDNNGEDNGDNNNGNGDGDNFVPEVDHGDNKGELEKESSGQEGDEDECAGVIFGGSGDEDESGFGSGEAHGKNCGNKKNNGDNSHENHGGNPTTQNPSTQRHGSFVQEHPKARAHAAPTNRQSQPDPNTLQWEDSPGSRAPAPSCFSGDTRVETSEGEKLMKDLQVGDRVLVPASGNTLRYERVAMFYHREPETRVRFVRLETENGKTLALTALHLLPFGECTEMIKTEFTTSDGVDEWMRKARFAHKAQVGDCLLTLDSQRNVQVERIAKVGREYSKGIYSPMTIEGSIITNNILSSCFSQIESHAAQKMAFDVIYNVYSSFGYLSGMAYDAVQEIPILLSYFHQFSWYLLPFAKY